MALRGTLAGDVVVVMGLTVDNLGDNGALDTLELMSVPIIHAPGASADALDFSIADVLLAAELDVGAVVVAGAAADGVHKGALRRLGRRAGAGAALLVAVAVVAVR